MRWLFPNIPFPVPCSLFPLFSRTYRPKNSPTGLNRSMWSQKILNVASNGTACNDGNPQTVSFCTGGSCVGQLVPEPGVLAGALAAVAALGALRRSRPRR